MVITFRHRPFLTTAQERKCLRQVWKEVRKNQPFELKMVMQAAPYIMIECDFFQSVNV